MSGLTELHIFCFQRTLLHIFYRMYTLLNPLYLSRPATSFFF
jgi:hypothetical protein